MKVQLLFFPDCPNADPARAALRRALAAAGLPDAFEEIDVTAPKTPEPLRAWGSPTILVDGRDVAGADPTGPSCRLYMAPDGRRTGVPPDVLIREALHRATEPRWPWRRSLALLPGALLPLLPSATCPACLAAYAGVLSAMGLGVLLQGRVLVPLIAFFLAVGVASVAWSTRGHGRAGPLVATVAGSLAVILGRIIWSVPSLVYGGAVLLVAASLWNAWLKSPRSKPLAHIGLTRKEGRDEEANDRGIHGGMSALR
jgi:mercuric ion transport protein